MENKNSALKACPFCGGDSELVKKGSHWLIIAKCITCGAGICGDVDRPNIVISKWNRRTPSSSPASNNATGKRKLVKDENTTTAEAQAKINWIK